MAGKPYHVVPSKQDSGSNKWIVKRAGAQRAYSRHNKKSRAVEEAKKVGRKQRVGVIVHRADGTTQYGYACDTTGARAKMVRKS